MKKYILVYNGKIVNRYESEQPIRFGGMWGNEDNMAESIEVDESLDLYSVKYIDGEVVEGEEE